MDIQIRFEFLDVKHFKHQTIKSALALSQNLEMALFQKIAPTIRFMKMLADCRMSVFSNTLKKVSGCVADTICITQIRYKMINKALLIDNSGHCLASLG